VLNKSFRQATRHRLFSPNSSTTLHSALSAPSIKHSSLENRCGSAVVNRRSVRNDRKRKNNRSEQSQIFLWTRRRRRKAEI